jgi:hypothetical protein
MPFWAVASFVRCYSRLFGRRSESWEGIVEFNEHIGWKPKPNVDALCTFAAGSFRVKTNADGWCGDRDLRQCHILALGDSFAFGFGVDSQEAFFSVIDSSLRVKAVGAPGYNMVQELLLLEELSPQLKGKLVVWLICLGNDIYDNVIPNLHQYRMPFVRRVNTTDTWEVVTSHIKSTRWPGNREQSSRSKQKWEATFTDKNLGKRAYSACKFLIEKGNEICNHADATLVIMTVPWMNQLNQDGWKESMSRFSDREQFDPNLPDRKISDMCRQLGVAFISGKEYLTFGDHIANEGHWNAKGHRRIAQLLVSIYQEHILNPGVDLVAGNVRVAHLLTDPEI